MPKKNDSFLPSSPPGFDFVRYTLTLFFTAVFSLPLYAQTDSDSLNEDLSDFSIEQLASVKVTSVSKKKESLNETAAAITVITSEDIRRSGATSIMEALRLAPGLQVARINAHDWAISARGFNDRFANKLLVLIDGRNVYTPTFSGVAWDLQDINLEDVDHIEVIRGPGGTIWGANAVNGVINVITKHARHSPGWIAQANAGTEYRAAGSLRYAGKLKENAYFRVFGKAFRQERSELATGTPASDQWTMGRGGFRLDVDGINGSHWTILADAFANRVPDFSVVASLTPPYANPIVTAPRNSGGNVLTRLTRNLSPRSEIAVQGYYSLVRRTHDPLLGERQQTLDLETTFRFRTGDRQEVVSGVGYRISTDKTRPSAVQRLTSQKPIHLANAYLQTEVAVVPSRLWITLGSKVEYNSYTAVEYAPAGRMRLALSDRQTLWAAVSQAVRTPSRAENSVVFLQQVIPPAPPGQPLAIAIEARGSASMSAERLTAYEAGYRFLSIPDFSIDITGFLNRYNRLRTIEPLAPVLVTQVNPPFVVQAVEAGNLLTGDTYGVEIDLRIQPSAWWRIRPSYSYLKMKLKLKPASLSTTSLAASGESPRHSLFVQSNWSFNAIRTELDATVRYVDALPARSIGAYWGLDTRLGWRAGRRVMLDIVGHNILGKHKEFTTSFITAPQVIVQPSIYGRLTVYF